MNHTPACNPDNNNNNNNGNNGSNNTELYGNQKLFESESQNRAVETESRWDKH